MKSKIIYVRGCRVKVSAKSAQDWLKRESELIRREMARNLCHN